MSYLSRMTSLRVLPIVLGLLGGCVTGGDDTSYGGDESGWGDGAGGYGGGTGAWCEQDTDCAGSGQVCARDGECLAAADVRVIHVSWTVSGQPASATTCTAAPDLMLTFSIEDYGNSNEYDFGFAPVPCAEGKFTIDKMPTSYEYVDLVRNMDESGGSDGSFDGSGDVSLDLPY